MIALLDRSRALYLRGAVVAATVALVAMVLVVGTQVVFRYVLGHPLTWTEELATYLFALVIFLGATIGIARGEAPALHVLVERLPAGARVLVETLADLAALAVAIALCGYGSAAARELMVQATPSMQIPAGIPNAIVPLAGLGFALHYALRVVRASSTRQGLIRLVAAAAVLAAFVWIARMMPGSAAPWMLLGTIVLGLAIGLPIALVLIGAVLATLLGHGGQPLLIVPETLFTGTSNVILMAVPFFMLTGAVMQQGGLALRLIDFSSAVVGRFRGGLLYVDILSSAIFADISGSAVADTAAIGSVMLPGMLRRGYDPRFATALQAASGTLGVLFPPSIATIIYAWVANVSVAEMFMASFLPAILMVVSFATVAFVAAARHDYPREPAASARELGTAFRRAFFALLAPIVIVGGVTSGIVTPAEAGVVAVIYTFLVTAVGYRAMTRSALTDTLVNGVVGTSRVMFILAGAILLSWMLTILQIPQQLSGAMLGISSNPFVLLIIINVLLVLVHSVLETSATLILVVPLVLPVALAAGISPIHLGIIFLINSALGLLTPPLGLLLYVAAPITGLRIEVLARALVPFLLTVLIDLALVIVFPQIVTVVPWALSHH